MSYNVDSIRYLGDGKLTIKRSDAAELQQRLEDNLAEGNFLEDLDLESEPNDAILTIENPWWYGEFSGRTFDDVFVGKILPATRGHALLLIVWEGGDDVTGLEVKDGVVTSRRFAP